MKRGDMDATQDEAIREHVMDLSITLTLIDRGLVRIVQLPSRDKKATFMMKMYTNQLFGKGNPLLLPLDERVTRGMDFEAINNVDAVLRTMVSQPFYFQGNESRGAYFSEATLEAVTSDPKGNAILNRARKWRAQK